MRYSAIVSMFLGFAIAGCERSTDKPTGPSKPPTAESAKSNDNYKTGNKNEDTHSHESAAHSGEVIELATNKIGEFTVRASRDKSDINPGGDAPIDVWVDGGIGKGVTAVRFWIGTEDAKGSIKAKADIEDGKWHTHVEIPSPIPAGSRLWVEIEESVGKKTLGSFDLKT